MGKLLMRSLEPQVDPSRNDRGKGRAAGLLLVIAISGCGGKSTSTATQSQAGPPSYFAPGVIVGQGKPQTYILDDTSGAFSQSFYPLAPQPLSAGTLSIGQRGLRSLAIEVQYVLPNGASTYSAVTDNPPITGSFAVELAGQTGALVQLVGDSPQPVVAATQCPALTTTQTYQFITIPGALVAPGAAGTVGGWDPTTETAYGSVDITSTGSTVTFQNIHQFILPSVGGTGSPAQPSASQTTGTCAPTLFGNTIAVPGQQVITDPSAGGQATTIAQATIGIGASNGLLVEDNGDGAAASQTQPGTSPGLPYNNVLGAGTGAVGLPRPASALDTGSLAGAQYLGFIDAVGAFVTAEPPAGASYHLASFGFSTVPASCAAVTASTGTLIYGGDFTSDHPSASPDGFGNCDFAIDFGAQDASNNGLYPGATVWVGAGYAGNATHATYSFPAVAVAGQVGSKFAIFVIGVDSTQPWAIYLLQSN